MTDNNSNSKFSLSLPQKSSGNLKEKSKYSNRLLVFADDKAYHFGAKGKLIFDIEKSKLTFVVSEEKSDFFIKKYKNQKTIEILKEKIKNIEVESRTDEKNITRYYFRLILKNEEKYIFSFNKEKNKNYEKIRDKFVQLLKYDYFDIYKSEFQKLDIITQKKICFFMKNEDLFDIYKILSKIISIPEVIYRYLKYIHPEKIIINLGLNRIQLSRDEELIMSVNLSRKNFNINKLIASDIDISKIYHKQMENIKFNEKEFWTNFYNNQKENKTYLVGEYNPVINHENDNEEIDNNNLMEELEKDKYYYDTYETNFLYDNNLDDEYNSRLFKTINNYSMNKMKEINYFSYSPMNINIYNIRRINNKLLMNKRNLSTSSNSNIKQNMEIELDNSINEINKKKRLSKSELCDRISQMKKEYQDKKLNNNNMDDTTMKTIIGEKDRLYNLTNKINFTNNNSDDLKDIYNKIFQIKDLAFILNSEIEARKKYNRMDQDKNNKISLIKNEMVNIYKELKKKEFDFKIKSPMKFLLRYAEYNTFI